MPILAKEDCIYPETLLDEPDLDGSDLDEAAMEPSDRCWRVLYTKARQEKSLARDMFALRIPFYLPLVKKTTARRDGRKSNSFVPIFAGYVFMFGTEEERVRVLTTNRISRTIEVDDPEQLVHDLQQLHQMIEADAPLTVESRLQPGNKVRVLSGALEGLEGTVMTRRGKARLLVAVTFLQQGASVEIEDYQLEPID